MKKTYFIISGIVLLLLCFIVGFSAWNININNTAEFIPEAYQVISLDDAAEGAEAEAFIYNNSGFLDSSYQSSLTTSFRIYYHLDAPSEAVDITITLVDEDSFLSIYSDSITAKYYVKSGDNYNLTQTASGKAITVTISSEIDFAIEYSITTDNSKYVSLYSQLANGKRASVVATAEGSSNWSINKSVALLMKHYLTIAWDYTSAFTYDGLNHTVLLKTDSSLLPDDISVVYENNAKKDAGEYTANATLTFDEDYYLVKFSDALLSSGDTCSLNWVVNPKDLSISVDAKTITYYDPAPTYTVTTNGLVDGESLASNNINPELSCSYVQGNNVGTYPITITNKTTGSVVTSVDSLKAAEYEIVYKVSYDGFQGQISNVIIIKGKETPPPEPQPEPDNDQNN